MEVENRGVKMPDSEVLNMPFTRQCAFRRVPQHPLEITYQHIFQQSAT